MRLKKRVEQLEEQVLDYERSFERLENKLKVIEFEKENPEGYEIKTMMPIAITAVDFLKGVKKILVVRYIASKYHYQKEIIEVFKEINDGVEDVKVIKNTKENLIIEVSFYNSDSRYYQLSKPQETITDITEIYGSLKDITGRNKYEN